MASARSATTAPSTNAEVQGERLVNRHVTRLSLSPGHPASPPQSVAFAMISRTKACWDFDEDRQAEIARVVDPFWQGARDVR